MDLESWIQVVSQRVKTGFAGGEKDWTSSHRDLTALLVHVHPCFQTKLSHFYPKYLGTNPDLTQGLKLPMTAIQPDFHRSSDLTVSDKNA